MIVQNNKRLSEAHANQPQVQIEGDSCQGRREFPHSVASKQELSSNGVTLASDWTKTPDAEVQRSRVDLEVFMGCCDVPGERELAKLAIENREALMALLKEVRIVYTFISFLYTVVCMYMSLHIVMYSHVKVYLLSVRVNFDHRAAPRSIKYGLNYSSLV